MNAQISEFDLKSPAPVGGDDLPAPDKTGPEQEDGHLTGGDKPEGTCAHCGEPFEPRKGTGGRPQKFCSEACRRSFHNAADSQRGPTPEASPYFSDPDPKNWKPTPECPQAVIDLVRSQLESTAKSEAEFNWHKDDSVIFRDRPATAIYFNPDNDLVIRQERSWDSEDAFIYIPKDSIDAFLDRLTEACGIPAVGR